MAKFLKSPILSRSLGPMRKNQIQQQFRFPMAITDITQNSTPKDDATAHLGVTESSLLPFWELVCEMTANGQSCFSSY